MRNVLKKLFFFAMLLVFGQSVIGTCLASSADDIDLALYYGITDLPQLKLYKNVVVQPYNELDPRQFNTSYRKAFVYAPVGETLTLEVNHKPIDPKWIIGTNKAWKTYILDQANPQWQQFFLDNIITPQWEKGFRGFYLDILDSYGIVMNDMEQRKKQQEGIITLIHKVKNKYPDAELILNRGFEIIPAVSSLISRVTVESVFSGWDNEHQRYFKVSAHERAFVLKEIDVVKRLGIPVTIIDYVSPANRTKINEVAEQIANTGCSPWVTDGDLTTLYLQNETFLPRTILILYNGTLHDVDERMGSTAVKTYSAPISHLGYNIEVSNVNESLPKIAKKKYAGVVVAIDGIILGKEKELYSWYLQLLKQKIPLVILNDFGFMLSAEKLKPFGLRYPISTHTAHQLHIIHQSPLINYEIKPQIKTSGFMAIQLEQGKGASLLTIQDETGLTSDVAAITSWGGYYLGTSFLPFVSIDEQRWAINPFEFFKQALHLPNTPTPDTTTENGRRLLFTHIDGDGFANKGEWFSGAFVGEVMRQEILERYRLPTTVSIIQGEIAANGLHPKESNELEDIAKKIFALPNVEIASHTYSHPFNWMKAAQFKGDGINPNILPIPNYRFDLYTEIVGSVEYINKQLAPKNKKCAVFLWSGEGDVPEQALAYVNELKLRNLNPGTLITKYNPSITRLSALGVNHSNNYFHVFAPIGNDNEAQGAKEDRFFYSLINIINALVATETPERLKPLNIYIHFFTMAQPGGVNALKKIYEWVLQQKTMPIFVSEYVDKVFDFNQLLIAPKNGGWLILGKGDLREFRIPRTMGYPDLKNSHNIVGFNAHNNSYYIHAAPGGDVYLHLTTLPPTQPYLVSANAKITYFQRTNQGFSIQFKGHVPIELTLAHSSLCTVKQGDITLQATQENEYQNYKLVQNKVSEIVIQCQ